MGQTAGEVGQMAAAVEVEEVVVVGLEGPGFEGWWG